MNKNAAYELAERKAREWNRPYLVLLRVEGTKHIYEVQPGESRESPSGYLLKDIILPQQ